MTYGSFERLLGPSQALFAGSLKEYSQAAAVADDIV